MHLWAVDLYSDKRVRRSFSNSMNRERDGFSFVMFCTVSSVHPLKGYCRFAIKKMAVVLIVNLQGSGGEKKKDFLIIKGT